MGKGVYGFFWLGMAIFLILGYLIRFMRKFIEISIITELLVIVCIIGFAFSNFLGWLSDE